MSVKAQAQSKIPTPPIDTFHDVMRSLVERHKLTVKVISDGARLSPARIREFLGGDDLPSRVEFKRLGHALPQLTYVFKVDQFDDPTEERKTVVKHQEQEVAVEQTSMAALASDVQVPAPEVQVSEVPGLQVASIEPVLPEPPPPEKPAPEDHGTFGETLRDARKREGLSRSDLAQILGVSRTAIEYWEANRYPFRHNFMSLVQLFPVLQRFDAEISKIRKQKETQAPQIVEEKRPEIQAPPTPLPATSSIEASEAMPSYLQIVELGEKLAAVQAAPTFPFLLETMHLAKSLGFDLDMLIELLENR
jgi:transcriptional regulator with XRE-family HTH domain